MDSGDDERGADVEAIAEVVRPFFAFVQSYPTQQYPPPRYLCNALVV